MSQRGGIWWVWWQYRRWPVASISNVLVDLLWSFITFFRLLIRFSIIYFQFKNGWCVLIACCLLVVALDLQVNVLIVNILVVRLIYSLYLKIILFIWCFVRNSMVSFTLCLIFCLWDSTSITLHRGLVVFFFLTQVVIQIIYKSILLWVFLNYWLSLSKLLMGPWILFVLFFIHQFFNVL